MSSHPSAPRTELEEEIDPHVGGEDQENQTSDDRLANNLYKDYSSQNQAFIQIFLALTAGGVGYGVEVRDAYAFFAKEKIDTEKLIKSPEYRAQVKKYAGHVNFWEKGAVKEGRCKLGAVLDGANKAIKEVDVTNEKLVNLKVGLIKDYSTELQNLYGLERHEIDAILQRAKYAVRADPNISMQDFVQREAQGIARTRLEKEIKKEKLNPEQKVGKIKARLSEIDEKFSRRTAVAGGFEKNSHFELTYNCKQKLDQIVVQPPTLRQSAPLPQTATPFKISLPNISLPRISLPNISFGGLGGGGGGLNLGGVLGDGFKSMFGTGGFLSKLGSGLARTAGGALPKLASFALPPLGAALTALTAIDALTGGLFTKGAAILVGSVAAIAIVLPIIIGIGVFSNITGDKPMVISSTNNRELSWNEFNNQYLTINSNNNEEKFTAGNTNQLSWQQFEKDYLILQKQYLSFEKTGQ